LTAAYTFIWNLLNLPAGIVPVTKVKPDEQEYKNDNYNDYITKNMKKQFKKQCRNAH